MNLTIPLAVLPPESSQTGAQLELTASGKITSLEGDHAVVHLTSINGAPLDESSAEPDLEEAALLERALAEDGSDKD